MHLLAIPFGPGEIVIIALVVVLLFGATKIPALMRGMGQGISEFKTGLKEGAKKEPEKASDESAKEEASEEKK